MISSTAASFAKPQQTKCVQGSGYRTKTLRKTGNFLAAAALATITAVSAAAATTTAAVFLWRVLGNTVTSRLPVLRRTVISADDVSQSHRARVVFVCVYAVPSLFRSHQDLK